MKTEIRQAYRAEMTLAQKAYSESQLELCFGHLERAHILGQRFFWPHLFTHWWMLKIAVRQASLKAIFGQILRIMAVLPGYVSGWVPKGNTGGVDVSAIRPMTIPDDLAPLLNDYSVGKDVVCRLIMWCILSILVLFAGVYVLEFKRVSHARVIEKQWNEKVVNSVGNFGAIKSIKITPLVNWHSDSENFITEPGVSYLIEIDNETILFDVGYNKNETNPSPLEHNLKHLNVGLLDIDTVFLSHAHRDHLGGQKWSSQNTFSPFAEQADLSHARIFAPVELVYPAADVITVKSPQILSSGVASTGPIFRSLFMGPVAEQALVLNLEGKGLVIIVGCGHQTVSKLISLIEDAFDEPIYGIVGDLHYPLPRGRLKWRGIDAQRLLASGDGIFNPISKADSLTDVDVLYKKLEFVMLGGHDTSDEMLETFSDLFAEKYHPVKIGHAVSVE